LPARQKIQQNQVYEGFVPIKSNDGKKGLRTSLQQNA
jgi:hypothetical protein